MSNTNTTSPLTKKKGKGTKKGSTPPARKSIPIACEFCHIKHLQCDVGRPCKNCIKRNIGNTCKDTVRKKKKRETEAMFVRMGRRSNSNSIQVQDLPHAMMPPRPTRIRQLTPPIYGENVLKGLKHEYHENAVSFSEPPHPMHMPNVLPPSGISLQNGMSAMGPPPPENAFSSWWSQVEDSKLKEILEAPTPFGPIPTDFDVPPPVPPMGTVPAATEIFVTPSINDPSPSSKYEDMPPPQYAPHSRPYMTLDSHEQMTHLSLNNLSHTRNIPPDVSIDFSHMSPFDIRKIIRTPKDLYRIQNSIKAFNYMLSYYGMIRCLKKLFAIKQESAQGDKDVLKSIVKEISEEFAPVILALETGMIPDDFQFQELTLQRMLLDLEDMATFSNCTPLVIWRRTGEICFANNEFLSLTGYTDVELTSRQRFIFEFWDRQSVFNYFKKFHSMLAFGPIEKEGQTETYPCLLYTSRCV